MLSPRRRWRSRARAEGGVRGRGHAAGAAHGQLRRQLAHPGSRHRNGARRRAGRRSSTAPAVGVAPEWMSEKAIAIGCYFVASGIDVILGHGFHINGSPNVQKFLNDETRQLFGASFHVCDNAEKAAALIVKILDDERRDRLGRIRKPKESYMI